MELSHPQKAFPSLESLNLFNLMNLKKICCSPITGASFSRLKTIKVKMCTQLKNLFSYYIVKLLTSLETLDVSECDYLEEIVVEEREVFDKVEFLKLSSLTLQTLPSFISFYTNNKMHSRTQFMGTQANTNHPEIVNAENEQSVTTSLSLFGEKVEILNLESLKLSSINVYSLWSGQLSSFFFQNLIKLTVEDCRNLKYLCSLSVASSLQKLKGLFVSKCRMMEKLFISEGNGSNNVYSKVCIFPKLEEIQITNMKMLKDIWPTEVHANSFSSLISVHVEQCEKIDKIFPCHMKGWYESLDSLKVVNCKAVGVIFDIRCPLQKNASVDTKLQLILLESLQNLKQVWGKDPKGVVNFTNLKSIKVLYCDKLSNVLPASIARGLIKLEDFSIRSCDEMEEIVASEASNEPLVFPEVITMELCHLRNIRRFYTGRHIVECPKLKRLVANNCAKLETFTTESINEGVAPVFSVEKVISNLEYMDIDSKEAKWLQSNIGKYHMHCLKQLHLRSLPSVEMLYWFLHRIPNLERLDLSFPHSGIEELVPTRSTALQQRLGTVLQLKELTLSTTNIKDIGFERDLVLRRVERLVLFSCRKLINLVQPSVSLTHLTYLEVNGCSGLENLMASSTAKSLVQLATMKVINCELKEIVTNEGIKEETVVKIAFGKLITIEFVTLEKLTSFCSYKNCEFLFPSLEKLILRDCQNMKTFTESHTRTPKLNNVLAVEGEEEEKWYWEGDLNTTVKKVFADKVSFEDTYRLELSCYPDLEQVWCDKKLVQKSFHNLKTLEVENCDYLVHVIPSHLLPCFKNLEELVVDSCKQVQVIFNINDSRVTKALGMFRLKKLSLSELPKLEHVWDKDTHGIIGLQVLQDFSVDTCNSLKYVFPASMAKSVTRLKKLSVQNCEQLVEIFAKDETAAEVNTISFVFHCLTSLELSTLPVLKYFYPGPHTLEFPVLKKLDMHPCKWVILQCEEADLETQVLIPVEKVNLLIPSLERLSLDMEDGMVTWDLKSLKLEFSSLQQFQAETDSVLFRFLQMVTNVENLEVKFSYLKEMFSSERPKADYARVLLHLKGLSLWGMLSLESIGLEHSWIQSIPENLQTLEVEWCPKLKNLVSCRVSFSSLTNLAVSYCSALRYLFTSSTAKSLAQLQRIEIRGCRSLQEVVFRECHESENGENIIFEQLQALFLEDLPMLTCFYSGNLTLCFPSLEEVSLFNCLGMRTFCPHSEITKKLDKLSGVGLIKDANRWEGDLDTTIRRINEKKIAESACDLQYLRLRESPHFQEIWCGSMPIPDACFGNLESLVVEGCEFLPEVLLPSNLLPFLNKMQTLEVRNCTAVKTIFDVAKDEKMTTGSAILPLKNLVLEKLPNLESVWNEDPDGFLRVELLQVHVDACKCLTSLFPTSVAQDLVKLENLEVTHCEGLTEIVAGIEATPEGRNLEFTFPSLTSLTLLNLPKLNCFYCSLRCVELKMVIGQDPRIEDAKEVTPNLDNLSLGEKELKMIWSGQCQRSHLPKLEVLDLQGFSVESDEFPYGFLEKFPSIKKLVVRDSFFKEIFCSKRPNFDNAGFVSQVKELKLAFLSELITIGLEHSWVQESFLNCLETLEVKRCSRLRNLVPSPVCFSKLMHLTVSGCDDMIHLFTYSTAKSLAQLKDVYISSCKSIQEIVSKEGDELHHDEIILGQLQQLSLESLPNLRSFYQGSFTLKFPSLEQLSVIGCGRMHTFCAGTINANKLSAVKFEEYGDATPLEDDLNFTIHKAFEGHVATFVTEVKCLELVDKPEVHDIWHGSFTVPNRCFINLKSLIVERCEFLSNVIPSHILGLLCKLEELVVRQCPSVKAIFEVKDIAKDTNELSTGPAFFPTNCCKKLTFDQLPNLEHIWDSAPQEVIGLQNLQEVYVHGCDNLERLFPASVAKSLVKLEKLEVQRCGRLMEIVAKDEAATVGPPQEFVLPCLTSIKLWLLPELKCFYPGLHNLECPKLKQVHLFHCDKLKTFTSKSQSLQKAKPEYQAGIPLHPQALFSLEKVIPYLEFLALNKEEAMMIWHGQFHVKLFHKLQALQLQCFHDDSDTFPYELLRKMPNIKTLVVSCCSFKEIFCSERPNTDFDEEILSHKKCLQLNSLSELNPTGLEQSWMDSICKNLEKLQIVQCHCLRNIVPPKVSFSSLIDLNVSQCGGFMYLFTPSTSRTLHQLKNMSIENCDSLEEIVFEEIQEESSKHDEKEIIFEQLKTLSLHSLPRLGMFYNGSVALSLPSLEQLSLVDCRKMQRFCAGSISVNKWSSVKLEKNEKAVVPLEVDLNFTIRKAFDMMAVSNSNFGVRRPEK